MRAHEASRIPGLGCRAVARCAVVCCSCSLNRMNPRVRPRVSVRVVSLIIPSMTATQSPHQLRAWFGLSSCSSMCALQHTALTSQMPALGCRAVARRTIVCCHCSLPVKCLGRAVEQLFDVRLCAAIAPAPVECLGWAVELLLDVLSCAAIAPSPEGSDES